MQSLGVLIDTIIEIYVWILVARVILSWLSAFRIINTGNQFVRAVYDFSYRLTEPLLRPIQRFTPAVGGVDLSPVVLILLLWFVRNLLSEYVFSTVR